MFEFHATPVPGRLARICLMMRRPVFHIAVVGVTTLLGVSAIVYGLIGNPLDPFDNRGFSSARWQRADGATRARMARSLIRRHLVVGMMEQQVVNLLGPPDEILAAEDAGGHKLPGSQTYSYGLGSWSLHGFDDAFLYVHLDSGRRVLSAEITGY